LFRRGKFEPQHCQKSPPKNKKTILTIHFQSRPTTLFNISGLEFPLPKRRIKISSLELLIVGLDAEG
jgi:hypothetical protein